MNHKGKAAGQGGWSAPPGGRTSDAAGLLGGSAILGTCTHELVGMEPMVGAAGGLPLLRAGLPPCGGAIGMPIISGGGWHLNKNKDDGGVGGQLWEGE